MKKNLATFLLTVIATFPNTITPENIIPRPQQFAYIENPSSGLTTLVPLPNSKPDIQARYEKKVDMNLVQRINNEINSNYRYVSDEKNFPRELDYWQTYAEFKERGSGDCDDFAIAKYHELKEEYPHIEIYLAIGSWQNPKKPNDKPIGHMVTALHYENEWWILDNTTKEVLRDIQRTDFRPSIIFNYNEAHRMGIKENSWTKSKDISTTYLNYNDRIKKVLEL